jgi:ABC-type transporter Mla subunit MlaD
MNLVLMLVIVLFSVAPAYAQGQETNSAKLKADAENVVKIIGSDKAKTQTYCQFGNLSDAIAQAIHEQDATKAKELSEKANDLEKNLGPEFAALADELKDMDPNSQDGQEVGAILDRLDEFCGN